LRRYGNELPADLRRYVTLGGRRKRRIKRLAIAGVAGVSLVAVLATAFGILAYSAEQTAAGNYAAAKRAADGLVASIPKSLQKKRNIEDDTLDIMFNLAGKMIDEIQAPDSDRGGYVARQLQAGFAIAQRLLRGDGAAPDESIALARSRANMLYEFAETYHRSANNLKRATELARDSLAIRQTLVQTGDASPQARAAVAMAQMELGDLLRRSIEMDPANHNRKNAAPADFASVRALFDPALATLEALHLLDPANREWALGDSKILTDRGDLYRKDGDFANAGALYARAQAVTLQVFSADTPDAKAVSELAWTYRKLGEVHAAKQERHPAAQAFSDEVCVRRWAASLDPNDPSYDEDLGYALAELGDALSRMDPPDHTAARDAFFEALVGWAILQEGNQSNPKFYDRFVDMLGKIGAEYRAEGQMDLSETFRRAAADVAANIALVFVQNTDAWTDQANRPSLLTQQTRLRNDGPFHMINIEGDRRQTIDNIRLEFVVGRLHDLRAGARGCWNRLTQGPMKQAASSIP
jgi:tetratricopeptide (TPR) repeat protein